MTPYLIGAFALLALGSVLVLREVWREDRAEQPLDYVKGRRW